ncbi:hypothetical protein [Streptomyces hebeiensis]
MSSQTEQTAAPAVRRQGTHHYVLTLDLPGRVAGTWYGTYTPAPGATRHDVFMALQEQARRDNPELARANVVFFALERNGI